MIISLREYACNAHHHSTLHFAELPSCMRAPEWQLVLVKDVAFESLMSEIAPGATEIECPQMGLLCWWHCCGRQLFFSTESRIVML